MKILNPNGYWNSTLRWPGSYSVSIQNVDDNNNSTNVTDFAPKNQDESREVKYTYGYKTGGDFSINRGGLTGNITKRKIIQRQLVINNHLTAHLLINLQQIKV